MTIDQVVAVSKAALREGLGETTMNKLRALFPDIHLTYCMDDDVLGVNPILRFLRMNVSLVDGRGHCLTLSESLDAATGLVLAEVIE
jgi:hypothetical protein